MNNQGDFSFRRSFFSIAIAFILMITMLAQSAWAAPSSADLKKEQSKKQGQLDDLNKQKNSVDSDLSSYIAQIEKVEADQKKVAAELEQAKADVADQYEDMSDRIVYMYEEGSVTMLNVLLESQSMGDFLNKAYYISTISDYDREMLAELKETSDQIAKDEAKLKEQRKELEKLKEERLAKQEALADQIAKASAELAAAKEAVAKASAAEKAEAEKKLKEAQAKVDQVAETKPAKKSSSSGSSSSTPSSGGNSGGGSGSWNGQKLTPAAGTIMGPSGKETYYNLDMSGVVRIMRGIGNNDPYWVRGDGVKMLGDYVMVAAHLGLRPRGSHILTSLGMGVVCDTGGFANNNPTQLDIATNW